MKKLGFGFMRLPMLEGENGQDAQVDMEQCRQMVDRFLAEGFTYFDTAHGYVGGKCEEMLKLALTSRHPRESYLLADKLTESFFKTEAEIRPLFEEQLEKTGVDYFDYYLIHSITASNYDKFVECNAFKVVQQLKNEGKIRHVGISFHDKPEMLERVLQEQPEIEVVQIQFNYVDYDNPSIESLGVYQVCEKYRKPVIVMEPCKGGGLVKLPEECRAILDEMGGGSSASYAIRYAASFPNTFMVLSGMSSIGQLEDNMSFMKDFQPFTEEEYDAVGRVREIMKRQDTIACTACRYCVDGCPKHISIPDLFGCYNAKKQFQDWNSGFYYQINTKDKGKASDCIQCGKCETICPQHLPVRKQLKMVAEEFERTEDN